MKIVIKFLIFYLLLLSVLPLKLSMKLKVDFCNDFKNILSRKLDYFNDYVRNFKRNFNGVDMKFFGTYGNGIQDGHCEPESVSRDQEYTVVSLTPNEIHWSTHECGDNGKNQWSRKFSNLFTFKLYFKINFNCYNDGDEQKFNGSVMLSYTNVDVTLYKTYKEDGKFDTNVSVDIKDPHKCDTNSITCTQDDTDLNEIKEGDCNFHYNRFCENFHDQFQKGLEIRQFKTGEFTDLLKRILNTNN
jgi:hypothetical protein